jgi:hypothetical protein
MTATPREEQRQGRPVGQEGSEPRRRSRARLTPTRLGRSARSWMPSIVASQVTYAPGCRGLKWHASGRLFKRGNWQICVRQSVPLASLLPVPIRRWAPSSGVRRQANDHCLDRLPAGQQTTRTQSSPAKSLSSWHQTDEPSGRRRAASRTPPQERSHTRRATGPASDHGWKLRICMLCL